MIRQPKGWALLDIRINSYDPFKNLYGFIAANEVLRFTAMLIGEVVDEIGTPNDFLGHAGGDNFILISIDERVQAIKQRLKNRFKEEVQIHYNFIDRQQGYIVAPDENGRQVEAPLMTLAVGVVSPVTHYFADIREITEIAAEERRQDVSGTA
jgi:GGDEF domain-containing protein